MKGERRYLGNRSWPQSSPEPASIALQFPDVGIGLRQWNYVLVSERQRGYENHPGRLRLPQQEDGQGPANRASSTP